MVVIILSAIHFSWEMSAALIPFRILKPKIIGSKGGLHPVLVLLGVVGGLKFLGFVGVIVGPIILAMLVTFINIYEEEKQAE